MLALQAIVAFKDSVVRSMEADWKAEKKSILQSLSAQHTALPKRPAAVSDAKQHKVRGQHNAQ
jgi:hypothetical protein